MSPRNTDWSRSDDVRRGLAAILRRSAGYPGRQTTVLVSFESMSAMMNISVIIRWPRIPASQIFLAQVRKFKIAGIQSEATITAATKWPSSEAWTMAEFSPFGPAKTKR